MVHLLSVVVTEVWLELDVCHLALLLFFSDFVLVGIFLEPFWSIHIIAGADNPVGGENEKKQSWVRKSDRTAVSSPCPFGTGHAPR